MKWDLDSLPKVIGVLSFGLLALSTVHDWAYFLVVGPKLRSIQTTYDYVSNAIEWLPILALGLLPAAFVIGLQVSLFGYYERELDYFRIAKRKYINGQLCFAGFVVVLVCLYTLKLPFPVNVGWIILGLLFGALMFAFLCIGHLRTTAIVLITFLATVFWGGADAFTAITKPTNVHTIVMKGGDIKQVSLLRIFEKGALVFDSSTQQVEFLRWEQIDRLSHLVSFDSESSGCRTFGWPCSQAYSP
jgi:hypothetical protein